MPKFSKISDNPNCTTLQKVLLPSGAVRPILSGIRSAWTESRRVALLSAGVILFTSSVMAQKVTAYLRADEVAIGEPVEVVVEISGGRRASRPVFPEVRGLQPVGMSQSSVWSNGSTVLIYSQTYEPAQAGTFTIPAFPVTVDGKRIMTSALQVVVSKNAKRGNPPPSRSASPDPFDAFMPDMPRQSKPQNLRPYPADYFLDFSLDKTEVYEGEQVIGEVTLYVNQSSMGAIQVEPEAISRMQQRIRNKDFWEEVYETNSQEPRAVRMGGKVYLAYTFYKCALFPLHSGDIAFNDLYLDAQRLYVTPAALKDPYSIRMGMNAMYQPEQVRAARKVLHVRPLPPTRLPNATLVGQVSMDVAAPAASARTGEEVKLRVNLKGSGNIAMMQPPVMEVPATFEQDEPQSTYEVTQDSKGISGHKTFEFSFFPTRSGEYHLGPVRYYYFDPERGTYDSLRVDAMPLNVTGKPVSMNSEHKKIPDTPEYTAYARTATDDLQHQYYGSAALFLGLVGLVCGAAGMSWYVQRGRRETPAPVRKNPLDD